MRVVGSICRRCHTAAHSVIEIRARNYQIYCQFYTAHYRLHASASVEIHYFEVVFVPRIDRDKPWPVASR